MLARRIFARAKKKLQRRRPDAGAASESRNGGPLENGRPQLLESCGVEFPDEARRADVSGRNITRVVSEDTQYFTQLTYLDAGDNCCTFEDFASLPRLAELRMHCNALRYIEEPLSDARVGYDEAL